MSWADELDADTVTEFDPNNVSRLFAQDWLVGNSNVYPRFPIHFTSHVFDSPSAVRACEPAYDEVPDAVLADHLRGLRNAILLPFCTQFNTALRGVLALGEDEARARIRRKPKREWDEWRYADLRAEVEAVCGEGRKSGREFFFSCPFHSDSSPSLHVNPETKTWHCFACTRGGGVVDWRKAIEGK